MLSKNIAECFGWIALPFSVSSLAKAAAWVAWTSSFCRTATVFRSGRTGGLAAAATVAATRAPSSRASPSSTIYIQLYM